MNKKRLAGSVPGRVAARRQRKLQARRRAIVRHHNLKRGGARPRNQGMMPMGHSFLDIFDGMRNPLFALVTMSAMLGLHKTTRPQQKQHKG